MPRLKICTCRIECEEIKLADGSTVFVCVECDAYAETFEGRLVTMEEKQLRRGTPNVRATRPVPR